jgi:alkanesulfonate monooxygenase SsuD/methylene tetrahydromethanopterin reductase-like flavin-dependent oxidoreductase (luciferase family)
VKTQALPLDRLLLGIGSPNPASLARVRDGVAALRALKTRIIVAALGPKMCRLAGEIADFVLLNWMVPARIAWARERVAEGAHEAGRDPSAVEIAAYVRVAVGPGSAERLAAEATRYVSMPHYARHFDAMGPEGADPAAVGVAAGDPGRVLEALGPYREVLDTLVVRGLPGEPTLDAHLAVAVAAAR